MALSDVTHGAVPFGCLVGLARARIRAYWRVARSHDAVAKVLAAPNDRRNVAMGGIE